MICEFFHTAHHVLNKHFLIFIKSVVICVLFEISIVWIQITWTMMIWMSKWGLLWTYKWLLSEICLQVITTFNRLVALNPGSYQNVVIHTDEKYVYLIFIKDALMDEVISIIFQHFEKRRHFQYDCHFEEAKVLWKRCQVTQLLCFWKFTLLLNFLSCFAKRFISFENVAVIISVAPLDYLHGLSSPFTLLDNFFFSNIGDFSLTDDDF